MSEPRLIVLPVAASAANAPTIASGSESMIVNGWTIDSNWLASTMKMKITAIASASPMLACESACSFCMPSKRYA